MIISAAVVLGATFSHGASQPEKIRFSGYDWNVKQSESKVGPGPNYFDGSAESAFVDSKGRLHLKIRKSKKGWTCSEVALPKSLGYGYYRFMIITQPKQLDDRAILGAFLYADDTREIDFELSRWGDAKSSNGQFVVQPYGTEGNIERFEVPDKTESALVTVTWQPDYVAFNIQAKDYAKSWVYKGKDNFVPGDERFIFNLWLMQGDPPKMEREYEVVISHFSYAKEWRVRRPSPTPRIPPRNGPLSHQGPVSE